MSVSPSHIAILVVGYLFGFVLSITVSRAMLVNISDAELYRFCMTHDIKLVECKIGWENLDRNVKAGKQP